MSIKQGNDFFVANNYVAALAEYAKIPQDSPLRAHAEFNIGLIQRRQQSASAVQPPKGKYPLLSIVMPVFNVAPYLDASINSALAQDCEDFELIIVNDASTDNGRRIVDMYKEQDPRIKVIHLDHNTLGGAGIPSNVGIRAAQGQYVGFIDSDDWVTKQAFKRMVSLARVHDADVVIGDFCTFTEDDRVVSPAYDSPTWSGLPLNKPISIATHPELLRLSPVPWRKLYRREFLVSNRIEYPEGDYFYEDNPLHWFVLTKAQRVVLTRELVSYHRMGREGQTMASNAYKLSAMCNHINTVWNFVRSGKLVDRDVVFRELYDYWYRSDWVVSKQAEAAAKSLIKKRLGQLVKRFSEQDPPKKVRPNLAKRAQDYLKAYPDVDITVVVPAYNSCDMLAASIDSVLALRGISYNVLLIDDGSTDGTLDVMRGYERKHDNVHVFSQGNKGAGRARNALIPLCTGTFTYFLDADDVIDAQSMETAVKQALAANNDLLFFRYRIDYHDEGRSRGMFNADRDIWELLRKARTIAERRSLLSALINYPWNRIIRTNLLHDANIFFGPTVVHNDIPYHWHSIVAAKQIGFADLDVCSHKKFSVRSQITNITDSRRMGVFEALRYTQERLRTYKEFSDVSANWAKFCTELLAWAKDRIPQEMQHDYEGRRRAFISALPTA